MANTADPGKKIDKAESIVRVTGWRAREQVLQHAKFAVAETMPCPLAGYQSLDNSRTPVALALSIQKMSGVLAS